MQLKIAKSAILAAMSLCLSIAGLVVVMLCTLWNEGWLIGQMESTGYYTSAADNARADCGAIIAQSGVPSDLIDEFITDDMVRQDIILSTDALFRNTGAISFSRFSNLKTTIEDVIYAETQQLPSEADQMVNGVVQFECEQQYAQTVKPPFFTAISILLQYKQISSMLLVSSLLIFLIGGVGLFFLCNNYRQLLQSISSVFAASGVSMLALGIIVLCSGFQGWMPQANLEYTLFVSWFQGFWVACLGIGVLLAAIAGFAIWYVSTPNKGAN